MHKNIAIIALAVVLAVSIVGQLDQVDMNGDLRQELSKTQIELDWAQSDLRACRGDFAKTEVGQGDTQ